MSVFKNIYSMEYNYRIFLFNLWKKMPIITSLNTEQVIEFHSNPKKGAKIIKRKMNFLKSWKKAILWQNRTNFLHPEASQVPITCRFLICTFEKPDNWKITGFRDPGHENGHKPSPDGTIPCCKRIMMINLNSKNQVNVTCVEFVDMDF